MHKMVQMFDYAEILDVLLKIWDNPPHFAIELRSLIQASW